MDSVSSSDVLWRRWLRCIVWQSIISSSVWLLWELVCPSSNSGRRFTFMFLPSPVTILGYITFSTAQLLFIVGETLVVQPEDKDSVSIKELVAGIFCFAWRALLGLPLQVDLGIGAALLLEKIAEFRNRVLFILSSVICGSLSLLSLASPMYSSLGSSGMIDMSFRGAILGLCYGILHIYRRGYVTTFPIIQRQLFFSFKLGLAKAIDLSLKMSLLMLPVAELGLWILHSDIFVGNKFFSHLFILWHQLVYFLGAVLITFCWEACRHLVQVILTKRHIFAPPLGSAAAETNPASLFLSILEGSEIPFLKYLAFLDLCTISEVSERHVESWRRAALFEETGETYRRIIAVSLEPLDKLAMKLANGLESSRSEKSGVFLMQQIEPSDAQNILSQGSNLKVLFRDFQLCSWGARTAAALTACSRTEDRFGVAQLSGCNNAVMSTLLSCLLVLEVYLGRRSSLQPLSFIGPNGIRWGVPYKDSVVEGDRKSLPFRKKSSHHKRGHAMADILRTAIYRIVAAFRDEMLLMVSGAKNVSTAERDWLNKNRLLFGTYEMHMQKLRQFLEFKE